MEAMPAQAPLQQHGAPVLGAQPQQQTPSVSLQQTAPSGPAPLRRQQHAAAVTGGSGQFETAAPLGLSGTQGARLPAQERMQYRTASLAASQHQSAASYMDAQFEAETQRLRAMTAEPIHISQNQWQGPEARAIERSGQSGSQPASRAQMARAELQSSSGQASQRIPGLKASPAPDLQRAMERTGQSGSQPASCTQMARAEHQPSNGQASQRIPRLRTSPAPDLQRARFR